MPGTDIVIKPELCITVLAQSPVFRGDMSAEPAGRMQLRVLVQGAMLNEHNLAGNLLKIEAELRDFENDLHMVWHTVPAPFDNIEHFCSWDHAP